MLSLFRRQPANPTDAAAPADEETRPAARAKGYTPSKKELGKITPKRSSPGRRPVKAAPADKREARRLARQARAEARAGMMAGKEEYLLPRDKGPERALVRDIVDSRRNVATYFLAGALVVLLGTSGGMPVAVRYGANILWVVLAAAVVGDSIVLARKVRRRVRARFPKDTRSHAWYAVTRSMAFRRMRMPAPRVKIGERA